MRHVIRHLLSFASLVVLFTRTASAPAQSIELDFSPSIVERISQLAGKVEAKPAETDESGAIWPMYRGNPQRTGQSPFKGPMPMRVKWQLDLKREICASPAVAGDGTIYAGAGAVFYAISADGRELWRHDFAKDGDYSHPPKRGSATGDNQGFTSPSPALAPDGVLYQACGVGRGRAGQGFVISLDTRPKADNRIRWAFNTSREMRSSPLIAGGKCFVGSRMALSLDAGGKLNWEGGKSAFLGVTSSPALSLDGATLYFGNFDGRLHALDAATGETKWTAGRETKSPIRFPRWDAKGKQIGRFTTCGYIPDAPAVGPDGTIYFGSWDGRLYAAAPDGRIRWEIDLEDRVTSAPAVCADGRVLVATYAGTLCAVGVLGGKPAVNWQVQANCRYSSPLVSADGKVYVGGLDGKLRAFALADGKSLGELAFQGWIYASPVPGGDGLLYVGASDGYLRAIETGAPSSRRETPAAESACGERKESVARRPVATRTITLHTTAASEATQLRYEDMLDLARAYMDEEDETKRREILQKVAGWTDRLDQLALDLRPVPTAGARTGHITEDKFTVPRIRARMERIIPKAEGPVLPYVPPRGSALKGPAPGEEYMNWVYVPEDYDPKKPLSLLISLHGGAGSTPQSEAGELLKDTVEMLGDAGFIVICPSTPPLIHNVGSVKFQFPESDIHIQSVIEEYSTRYAIDPNRVFLMGYSMGGIGAWWQAFRHGDRFAVIAPIAGTWRAAYWPKLRGTFLYVVSGAFDHHTHVDHARYADEQMRRLGIPHIDAEYLGAHGRGLAGPQQEALGELFKVAKRDPYCRRACAVSPFIPDAEAMRSRYRPLPHSFWASVLEAGPDGVLVDYRGAREERGFEGDDDGNPAWQRKMFAVERRLMNAGAVDAENLGGNRFRVKATNVKRFALRLHPKMGIDLARPIEIELIQMAVDAKTNVEVEQRRERVVAMARPSLGAMLSYLGERRDYGLIYHAAVEVECGLSGVRAESIHQTFQQAE